MNSISHNTYRQQYNHSLKYQQGLSPPPNQIPPNYEYYPGMMPYMNLPMKRNTLGDQKMFPIYEYYFEGQGNTINQKDIYEDNNIIENNKIPNESPAKSTNEDSKLSQKENSTKKDKNQERHINTVKDNYINLLIKSIIYYY